MSSAAACSCLALVSPHYCYLVCCLISCTLVPNAPASLPRTLGTYTTPPPLVFAAALMATPAQQRRHQWTQQRAPPAPPKQRRWPGSGEKPCSAPLPARSADWFVDHSQKGSHIEWRRKAQSARQAKDMAAGPPVVAACWPASLLVARSQAPPCSLALHPAPLTSAPENCDPTRQWGRSLSM